MVLIIMSLYANALTHAQMKHSCMHKITVENYVK